MSVDISKLQFSSTDAIDKIVLQDTITIVNSGATSDYAAAKITTNTIANPYGRKVMCRYSWSIDGGGYNSADTRMSFSYTITTTPPGITSTPIPGLKAAVSVGVNDSTITFLTANGEHGNVADNAGVITYTPISHTFTIKYALFEVL